MAGNAPHLPPDTRSREIRVLLVPNLDDTLEDTDWEVVEDEAHALRDRIVVFADSVREQVKGLRVTLPPGCIGRAKEKWRPLKRVAVAAGGGWPDIVDGLIIAAVAQEAAEREAGLRTLPPGVVLLTDLHAAWPADDGQSGRDEDLVDRLIEHNADYWSEQQRLRQSAHPAAVRQTFVAGGERRVAASRRARHREGSSATSSCRCGVRCVWSRPLPHRITPETSATSDRTRPTDPMRAGVTVVIRYQRVVPADIGDAVAMCARCGKGLTDPEGERRGICAACLLASKRQEA